MHVLHLLVGLQKSPKTALHTCCLFLKCFWIKVETQSPRTIGSDWTGKIIPKISTSKWDSQFDLISHFSTSCIHDLGHLLFISSYELLWIISSILSFHSSNVPRSIGFSRRFSTIFQLRFESDPQWIWIKYRGELFLRTFSVMILHLQLHFIMIASSAFLSAITLDQLKNLFLLLVKTHLRFKTYFCNLDCCSQLKSMNYACFLSA